MCASIPTKRHPLIYLSKAVVIFVCSCMNHSVHTSISWAKLLNSSSILLISIGRSNGRSGSVVCLICMCQCNHMQLHLVYVTKGHFKHESRAVTMKLWEPKRKCPKAVPTHLQNHVVWSWTLKCSVKSYVTGASAKYYFYECLYMRVFTHDKNRLINGCEHSDCHEFLGLC